MPKPPNPPAARPANPPPSPPRRGPAPLPPALIERFVGTPWVGMSGLDEASLRILGGFLELRTPPDGERLDDFGSPPEGVIFVLEGAVGVATHAGNGAVTSPVVLGAGQVFGEELLAGVNTVPLRVHAVRGVKLLVLPTASLDEALLAAPALGQALLNVGHLRKAVLACVRELRRRARFGGAGFRSLYSVVQRAEVRHYAAGEQLLAAGQRASGLYYLAEGVLQARTLDAEAGVAEEAVLPGSLFGGFLSLAAAETATIVALAPSTVLTIAEERLAASFASSPALRRSELGRAVVQSARLRPPVFGLRADRPRPVGALCELVADYLVREFKDRAVVLHLTTSGKAGGEPTLAGAVGVARRGQLRLPEVGAAEAVADAVEALGAVDLVLLDLSALSPAQVGALEPVMDRLWLLVADSLQPPGVPFPEERLSWIVQIGERSHSVEPAHRSGSVRVRFAEERLGRARALGDLDPEDVARVGRVARALTDRRVGVALGGGGAWGFAHLALLDCMHQAGIPIDLVSGASFGSLCGAFVVTAKPGEWTKAVFGVRTRAQWATRLAMINSYPLQRIIDDALGKPRLEDLEVPFFPVATDVLESTEVVPTIGTVGFGVRASSSFPGIFGPTTGPNFRYVDGGIIRNVPVDPLVWQGADLIIASNPVPPPAVRKAPSPLLPGRIGRFVYELNVYSRLQDVFRSSLILMHTAGDASAADADVIFRPPYTPDSPADFENGEEIYEAALPHAKALLPRILSLWSDLRGTVLD